MTLESQDNKTTDCCPFCKCVYGQGFDHCENPQCKCHFPATDDMVEVLAKRIIGITERGDDRDWEPQINALLNEVISRTREERDKMAAKYGAERFSEGIREERERIAKEWDRVVKESWQEPQFDFEWKDAMVAYMKKVIVEFRTIIESGK